MERGDTCTVRGYKGVAFIVLGPEKVWEHTMVFCIDNETGQEFEAPDPCGEGEWVEGDGTRLQVRMVGDDHVFTVDATDCTALPEDQYCQECGQIGCCINVRAEE